MKKNLFFTLIVIFLIMVCFSCNQNKKQQEAESAKMEDSAEIAKMNQGNPSNVHSIAPATAVEWIEALPESVYGDYASFDGIELAQILIYDVTHESVYLNIYFDYNANLDEPNSLYSLRSVKTPDNVQQNNDSSFINICDSLYLYANGVWSLQQKTCDQIQEAISEAEDRWGTHFNPNNVTTNNETTIYSFIVPIIDIIELEEDNIYIYPAFDNNSNLRLLISNVEDISSLPENPVFFDACYPCPYVCARFD